MARVVPRFDGDETQLASMAMEEEVSHAAIMLSTSTGNQRERLGLSGFDGRSGSNPRGAGTVPGRAQPVLAAQIRRLGTSKRAQYLVLYEQWMLIHQPQFDAGGCNLEGAQFLVQREPPK
jgi:hypothetical protein